MKKWITLLLTTVIIFTSFALMVQAETVDANTNENEILDAGPSSASAAFAYEHDPRDNPNAMKDIVVNPEAIYGFSPSPDSSRLKNYADAIDWTDAEQVADARALRQAYHDSMSELYRMIEDMLLQGNDVETIARAVSQRRNELRLESEQDDPEALALTKQSNLETYGNELGPTADQLYEKYGSWQTVLEKALGTNAGMDACLGFYDEYYDLYDIGSNEETKDQAEEKTDETAGYTLERVVILSRHNIRSPLSGSGSLLEEITPHEWFQWTSPASELSLRGGILETMMGQYFRLWLEKEGLFPENAQPEDGEVRFYANAKQRTLATAKYFSAGLFPVSNISIESHAPYDTMDPVFDNSLNFVSEAYTQDVLQQIADIGGSDGMDGILSELEDALSLLMDVVDMKESTGYLSGKYGDLTSGETVITLKKGSEPSMTGPIKNATSIADALVLQYYEEKDDNRAAFGHVLSMEDWRSIHAIVDKYTEMLFCTPLVSVNIAYPLIREIRAEMTAEGRKFAFLCAHDSNIASLLAALNYGEYELPDAVEQHTPIGVKLVFERWLSDEDEAFWKVNMVYQSTQQLRDTEQLTLENPPVVYPLLFEGMDANGFFTEEALFTLLDDTLDAYDALLDQYGDDAEEYQDAA